MCTPLSWLFFEAPFDLIAIFRSFWFLTCCLIKWLKKVQLSSYWGSQVAIHGQDLDSDPVNSFKQHGFSGRCNTIYRLSSCFCHCESKTLGMGRILSGLGEELLVGPKEQTVWCLKKGNWAPSKVVLGFGGWELLTCFVDIVRQLKGDFKDYHGREVIEVVS